MLSRMEYYKNEQCAPHKATTTPQSCKHFFDKRAKLQKAMDINGPPVILTYVSPQLKFVANMKHLS